MKMKATVSLFLLVCATLLISTLGRIRSKKIYSEFNEYYADEFLKELPSHMVCSKSMYSHIPNICFIEAGSAPCVHH